MKLSLSFIRLCIGSGKISGFEVLSFVETRHVSFMLQAFRLNETCRCITTSNIYHSIKELHMWNHCFLNCLGGRYLAPQYHWHIGSWDDLDHFYHNLSQSAPGSEGLGCTQFVRQCAINRALVVDPTTSPISPMMT